MSIIKIDATRCQKDQLCIMECPFHCLIEGEDGVPFLDTEKEQFCMKCGHCVAICPTAAVSLDGVSPEICEPAQAYPLLSPLKMATLLKNRRSIRTYRNKPVPRETAAEVLEMVRWAPTAKNGQPVQWLMVDNRKKIEEIGELVIEWLRSLHIEPAVVAAWEKGDDIILRQAPLLAIAHAPKNGIKPVEDCCIALTSLELAATTFGIGSFWAGYFMTAAQNFSPLQQFLALPEENQVYAALGMGYPKMIYHRIPSRNKTVVHWL